MTVIVSPELINADRIFQRWETFMTTAENRQKARTHRHGMIKGFRERSKIIQELKDRSPKADAQCWNTPQRLAQMADRRLDDHRSQVMALVFRHLADEYWVETQRVLGLLP